jgi:hypothetical protein
MQLLICNTNLPVDQEYRRQISSQLCLFLEQYQVNYQTLIRGKNKPTAYSNPNQKVSFQLDVNNIWSQYSFPFRRFEVYCLKIRLAIVVKFEAYR